MRDGFGKHTGADYSHDSLKKILAEQLSQTTLGDIQTRYGGQKMLMVTTFHLNPQEEGVPVNFRARVYNSNFRKDQDLTLVDAILRSTAAPTYFPIYQEHIDGGVAINHPAMSAVAFALNNNTDPNGDYCYPDGKQKGLRRTPADLKVFSLGTGTSNRIYIDRKTIGNGNWGSLHWVKYLPDLLIEANVQVSEYYVRQVLPDSHYRRVDLKFDDPAAPAVIQKLIRRNKTIGLDEKRKEVLLAMRDFARRYYQQHESELLDFLGVAKPSV